jgi:excisionase family DNA binding protein
MQKQEWLTLREAADALGISEVSARRWVKSGKLAAAQPGRKYLIPASAVEEMLNPKALPDLDAADLEDWASEVDTLDELRPVHRALWLQWRELADYDRVVRGGERALADALEAEEKRTIIDRRMMELAPAPLATIAMHLDEPTWVIYHRDPTDDERATLIAEYPDAVEVEAERVALAY